MPEPAVMKVTIPVKLEPEPLKEDAVTIPEEFTEETVMFGDPVRFCATVAIPEVVAYPEIVDTPAVLE